MFCTMHTHMQVSRAYVLVHDNGRGLVSHDGGGESRRKLVDSRMRMKLSRAVNGNGNGNGNGG